MPMRGAITPGASSATIVSICRPIIAASAGRIGAAFELGACMLALPPSFAKADVMTQHELPIFSLAGVLGGAPLELPPLDLVPFCVDVARAAYIIVCREGSRHGLFAVSGSGR